MVTARRKPDVIPEGALWCARCQRVKPAEQFYRCARWKTGRRYDCRQCDRIASALFRASEAGREWHARYRASERGREVQAARKADPDWRRRRTEETARYRETPVGRLVSDRARLRYRLGRRKTEEARARLRHRVVEVEVQLMRLGWRPRERRAEAS